MFIGHFGFPPYTGPADGAPLGMKFCKIIFQLVPNAILLLKFYILISKTEPFTPDVKDIDTCETAELQLSCL